MKVKVDSERCIGSGNCVVAAGHVFAQDDVDGTVQLRQTDPIPVEFEGQVRDAAAVCPVSAIELEPRQG